jgi:hypothetical protein
MGLVRAAIAGTDEQKKVGSKSRHGNLMAMRYIFNPQKISRIAGRDSYLYL